MRASILIRTLLLSTLALGTVFGHAALDSSQPARGATLDTAPAQVVLHFTERVETRFSIFKVYPLGPVNPATTASESVPATPTEASAGATPAATTADESPVVAPTANPAPLEGMELLRLNGLAGALVDEVLMIRGDDAARADTGLVDTVGSTKDVSLGLRSGLAPGDYVVMWRVLSEDTHSSQDYLLFRIAPPAP